MEIPYFIDTNIITGNDLFICLLHLLNPSESQSDWWFSSSEIQPIQASCYYFHLHFMWRCNPKCSFMSLRLTKTAKKNQKKNGTENSMLGYSESLSNFWEFVRQQQKGFDFVMPTTLVGETLTGFLVSSTGVVCS